uniref:Gut-specific cysteine proteinase n=1 Tax=Lygus hesperus TaxID=30085 RepID=A0A146KXP4_LYGHE
MFSIILITKMCIYLALFLPVVCSEGRVGVLPVLNVTGLFYGGAGPNVSLPISYDWRSSHGRCVDSPFDSGNCEASWAIAAASAATDRSCMEGSPGFTPTRVLSCCGKCGVGCYGGYPWMALQFLTKQGSSTPTCQPMEALETTHIRSLTPFCPLRYCQNLNQDYTHVFTKGAYLVRNIDNEIFTNGPVVAYIDLHDEFLDYSGGVYEAKNEQPIGKLTVKLLGWGIENGKRFWIGENSWGTEWGEKGYFRIRRGTNTASIERNVMAPLIRDQKTKH